MGTVPGVIVSLLELAASIAGGIGDVITQRRVEEIITDRFPTLPRRATETAERARERIEGEGHGTTR